MKNLTIHWLVLLSVGLSLIAVDMAYRPLVDINGVPAISVIGAALIVLVVTSWLNWQFKKAWEERSRSDNDDNAESLPT